LKQDSEEMKFDAWSPLKQGTFDEWGESALDILGFEEVKRIWEENLLLKSQLTKNDFSDDLIDPGHITFS